MRGRALAASLLLAGVLTGCVEDDATAFERATESFFTSMLEFFMVLFLMIALFIVLWALVFAGAATVLIAGIRRLTTPRAPTTPPADPADQHALPASAPTTPPADRSEPDWVAVGMIIFGGVLLLIAAPAVFSINLGFTSPGQTMIPLPLIVAGVALVVVAARRRKPPQR